MILSDSGKIVSDYFYKIPTYHKRIILDEWVIMPNHFHCLITLGDYDFDNGVSDIGDDCDGDQQFANQYHKIENPTVSQIKQYRKLRRKMLIPKIIGKFEMQTSKKINIINNTIGNKTWQKDYNDHVIRNNIEYQRIEDYIKNNPSNWDDDTFNKKN